MSGSEKKKATKDTSNKNCGEHIRHFLYKMCNWDVSRCHVAKQRQKNVQESVLHLQSFFWLIRTIDIFAALVAIIV